jgi:hypothetical protein
MKYTEELEQLVAARTEQLRTVMVQNEKLFRSLQHAKEILEHALTKDSAPKIGNWRKAPLLRGLTTNSQGHIRSQGCCVPFPNLRLESPSTYS